MDALITVKFYRVIKPTAAAPNFETILAGLSAKDLVAREATLDEGILLRLERLVPEATYRVGEFCRIQHTNIPPSAGPDGLTPTILEGGKGLGHLAAFRYHTPTQVLALQSNLQCATPNRIALYLSVADGAKPLYQLDPVLKEDALKRIGGKEIREFQATFAEPQNLEALDDPALSAMKGVRRAARALNGHEVEIRIKAGRSRKRHLNQLSLKSMLKKMVKLESVTSLAAGVAVDRRIEWFDLLEDQLKATERLELPSDNPDANYEERKRFITGVFNANLEMLRKLFGPNNGAD